MWKIKCPQIVKSNSFDKEKQDIRTALPDIKAYYKAIVKTNSMVLAQDKQSRKAQSQIYVFKGTCMKNHSIQPRAHWSVCILESSCFQSSTWALNMWPTNIPGSVGSARMSEFVRHSPEVPTLILIAPGRRDSRLYYCGIEALRG